MKAACARVDYRGVEVKDEPADAEFEEPRDPDHDDLVAIQTLARRAALALDNAQAYQAAQRAREAAERASDRLARLQAVTAAMTEMRASIESVVPPFSAHRMVRDYVTGAYLPAAESGKDSAGFLIRGRGQVQTIGRAFKEGLGKLQTGENTADLEGIL